MRVAAVQMRASADRDSNLQTAEKLCDGAVIDGAKLIVLPEMFNLFGNAADLENGAEPLDGPTGRWASSYARKNQVWLVAGSIIERNKNDLFNTSCLYNPEGALAAAYRKVHLFDNEVSGASYNESRLIKSGNQYVVAEMEKRKLGICICYDIRFPEIFRAETLAGAEIIAMPMAFMERTGRDHLEPLMRARAIENQIFLVLSGQSGMPLPGINFYGGTSIIDPWGDVLVRAIEDECFVTTKLDFEVQKKIRAELPVLADRRSDVYNL